MTTVLAEPVEKEHGATRLECPSCKSSNVVMLAGDLTGRHLGVSECGADFGCDHCGHRFNVPRAGLVLRVTNPVIERVSRNTPIHELDLMDKLPEIPNLGIPDQEVIKTLQNCAAVLSCEDSSPKELFEAGFEITKLFNGSWQQRSELVSMMEAYIESKVGSVHWLRHACCEGDCEVCNAREKTGDEE
ncbi:MAG TPA: hypothetical protein VGB77_12855 [Abditibacteriaceae bacterium]|jgi:hypothetical protein